MSLILLSPHSSPNSLDQGERKDSYLSLFCGVISHFEALSTLLRMWTMPQEGAFVCWIRHVGVAGSPCSQLLIPKDIICPIHPPSGVHPLILEPFPAFPPAGKASPELTELLSSPRRMHLMPSKCVTWTEVCRGS